MSFTIFRIFAVSWWRRGVVVITTAQLYSAKPKLRLCWSAVFRENSWNTCDFSQNLKNYILRISLLRSFLEVYLLDPQGSATYQFCPPLVLYKWIFDIKKLNLNYRFLFSKLKEIQAFSKTNSCFFFLNITDDFKIDAQTLGLFRTLQSI